MNPSENLEEVFDPQPLSVDGADVQHLRTCPASGEQGEEPGNSGRTKAAGEQRMGPDAQQKIEASKPPQWGFRLARKGGGNKHKTDRLQTIANLEELCSAN